MARYYLGFDVGGSRTRARVVDAGGAVLGAGEAGPGNTRMGLDHVHAVLREASLQAMATGGLGEEDLGEVAMGGDRGSFALRHARHSGHRHGQRGSCPP